MDEPPDNALEVTKQQSHYKRHVAGHTLWIAPECRFVHSTQPEFTKWLILLANRSHQWHINERFVPAMQAQAKRYGRGWQVETSFAVCETYGSRLDDGRILWIELCTDLVRPESHKISTWATTAKIIEVK
jgi:hypothetical protein